MTHPGPLSDQERRVLDAIDDANTRDDAIRIAGARRPRRRRPWPSPWLDLDTP
jgi:hypothetical protein